MLGVLDLRSVKFCFLQVYLSYTLKLNLSKVLSFHTIKSLNSFLFPLLPKGESNSSIIYKLLVLTGVNLEQMKSRNVTGFNFRTYTAVPPTPPWACFKCGHTVCLAFRNISSNYRSNLVLIRLRKDIIFYWMEQRYKERSFLSLILHIFSWRNVFAIMVLVKNFKCINFL